MSTNFYWLPLEGSDKLPTGEPVPSRLPKIYEMNPTIHLGLRYGAGIYCWDCGQKCNGKKICPKCNSEEEEYEAEAGPGEEAHGTMDGIGGRDIPVRWRGVGFAYGFHWAQDPKRVYAVCAAMSEQQIVSDEYNHPYTGKEFLTILSSCPIQHTDSIGKEFC